MGVILGDKREDFKKVELRYLETFGYTFNFFFKLKSYIKEENSCTKGRNLSYILKNSYKWNFLLFKILISVF